MRFYPLFLDLRGRECVVVGGGEVATRKVEGLLKAGARITVISPEVTQAIRHRKQQGRVRHIRRSYRTGDLKGTFLAYAATGNSQVDTEIAEEARSGAALINVVDRPALCDFITPALLERGDLVIAISTGGKSPGLARKLREDLESIVGPEYEKALELVSKVRQSLMAEPLNEEARREILAALIDSPLVEVVRQGNVEGVESLLHQVTGGTHWLDGEEGQPSKKVDGNLG